MDTKLLILTKTKPFTGTHGQNWNQWISRFEVQTATFSDADRIQCLSALLEEKALDSYASLPEKDKASYARIKESLAARYGTDVGILQAQAELAGAMQGPGESVADFADRIRLLGRAAYPKVGDGDVSVQSNLTSRFLCGLHDERLQDQLCGEDLRTLQAAVDKASALHKRRATLGAMRQAAAGMRSAAAVAPVSVDCAAVSRVQDGSGDPAMGGSGICPPSRSLETPSSGPVVERSGVWPPNHPPETPPSGAVGRARVESDGLCQETWHPMQYTGPEAAFGALPAVRPSSHGEGFGPLVALERRLDAIQRTVSELQAGSQQGNAAMGGRAGPAGRVPGAPRNTGERPGSRRGRCWTCGEQGTHYARECPHSGERTNYRREQPFCLGCGGSGHWMVDCRRLAGTAAPRETDPATPRSSLPAPFSGLSGNC